MRPLHLGPEGGWERFPPPSSFYTTQETRALVSCHTHTASQNTPFCLRTGGEVEGHSSSLRDGSSSSRLQYCVQFAFRAAFLPTWDDELPSATRQPRSQCTHVGITLRTLIFT